MATIRHNPCACPRSKKATCAHRPYTVTYREPGGRQGRQVDLSFKKMEDAKAFAIKVEHDKKSGTYVDPRKGRALFSEVWEEWVSYGTLQPSSKKRYEEMYRKHFAPPFGNKTIGSISVKDISDWYKDQGTKAAKTTVENRRGVLNSVFRYAIDLEYRVDNPCRRIRLRREDRASLIHIRPVTDSDVPSKEEVVALIAAMPEYLRLAAWFMAGCGLRPAESLAVSIDAVDLESRSLIVSHQVVAKAIADGSVGKRIKEGTKHRDILESRKTPIPDLVADAFRTHVEKLGTWSDRKWLFESVKCRGQHPTTKALTYSLERAMRDRGLGGYTPKSFRHFFASQALHAGVPMYEVSRWLGHRSIRTTEQTYAHLVEGALGRGADLLGSELAARAGSV